MTTTPTPTAPAVVTRAEPGTLLLRLGDDSIELTVAQAEVTATALREAVYAYAPAMTRVRGYYADTDRTMRVIPDEEIPAYEAEGLVDLEHGLACPHPDCEGVAWHDHCEGIVVVDGDERWSTFGYRREQADEEAVVGAYADTDYQSLGYRCETCGRPVSLPAGVEEEGN